MPTPSQDMLVDALRVDLAQLGCRRLILLGTEDEMESGGLRSGLARWGLQVLVPPAEQRAWITSLARINAKRMASADAQRLRTLLEDGLEHGVEAIVTTSNNLATLLGALGLAVPVLTADPLGSVVPLKNVVFDMGGVLFRWDPLAMACRVAQTDEDAHLLADMVFGSPEWAWQDAGAVDEQTVIWTAKAHVPRRLHASIEELVLHWHDHRTPIAGMDELIRDLKAAGYGIYLLSNAGTSFARYEAQLPAYECFDGRVVSCYEHIVKPDARLYRTLLDRFSLKAEECLFIDDTQKNVFGARRVGMRAYHFDGDTTALRAILLP